MGRIPKAEKERALMVQDFKDSNLSNGFNETKRIERQEIESNFESSENAESLIDANSESSSPAENHLPPVINNYKINLEMIIQQVHNLYLVEN